MAMSDPLGDMLTRIRNGQHAQKRISAALGQSIKRLFAQS